MMNNKMLVKLNKQTINYPRLNKKLLKILDEGVIWVNNCYILQYFYNLKSATIIQYTIKGRFMSR